MKTQTFKYYPRLKTLNEHQHNMKIYIGRESVVDW